MKALLISLLEDFQVEVLLGPEFFKHEAEETVAAPGGSDVRKERIDQIYSLLRGYTAAHKGELKSLRIDPDDFVQDVIAAIFRRKGLHSYDPSKGLSFETLIFRIAKNYLVDKYRAAHAKSRTDPSGRPIELVSLDAPLRGRSGDTLADVLGGGETEREGEEYHTPEPNESMKTQIEVLANAMHEMDDTGGVQGVALVDLVDAIDKETDRLKSLLAGRTDEELAKTLAGVLSKLVGITSESVGGGEVAPPTPPEVVEPEVAPPEVVEPEVVPDLSMVEPSPAEVV